MREDRLPPDDAKSADVRIELESINKEIPPQSNERLSCPEKYLEIMALMGESCFETDLDGKFTFFNDHFCRFYGRPRQELLQTSLKDHIGADHARTLSAALEKIIGTRAPSAPLEMDVIRKDGAIVSAKIVVSPLENATGRLIGFCGIARDVTTEKQMEIAARESDEEYHTILNKSPFSIVFTRLSDLTNVFVNDNFCLRTGYSREEVIGKSSAELSIFKNNQESERFAEILRVQGKVEKMEAEFKTKDGRSIESMISARLIKFKGEDCILNITVDISELKAAQRAVTESEKSYRTILDAAPYAITITRISDLTYVQVNDAFCQHTGYRREEVIGRTATELNLYADPAEREVMIEKIRRHNRLDSHEMKFRCKNGCITHTLASARIIPFKGEPCFLLISSNIDALKASQKALQESEASYRDIMKIAPYSITISRLTDGKYIEVNDSFCSFTGYERKEILGRTFRELGVFADKEIMKRFLRMFIKNGRVDNLEIQFKSRGGALAESLISARTITYKGEACLLSISTDITDLKKVQRALAESEESYRTIMDTAPYTIVIARVSDSTFLQVNEAFCRHTGYTREEALGRTIFDLDVYVDPSQRVCLLEKLGREGQVSGAEVDFRYKNGEVVTSLVSLSPIRYQGEDCTIAMTVDISELKQTQRDLEDSETLFRTIFETAADPIFLNDFGTLEFIDVNQAACRHLGYEKSEFPQITLFDVMDPSFLKNRKADDAKLNLGIPHFFESLHLHKDGSKKMVEVNSQLMNHKGRKTLLSIARDVTQRKRTEQELARYREDLEQMVAERTEALKRAQDELIKREKLSVLGQLTATVSHELRNPLGVIRTSCFYLQRKIKDRDEKTDKHFKRIEEQVTHCDAIVADLLEYTRGRTVSLVRQDLIPLIKQVAEQLQEQEGVRITLNLADDLPLFSYDQDKIRRVIINLATNAIQAVAAKAENAAESGRSYRPEITLEAASRNEQVVITVTDNGIGMSPETLRRAFEPLFTTRSRGTGIGLANVKKIIDEHGGRIALESRLGEWTQIKITLPCLSDDSDPSGAKSEPMR